MQNRDEERNNDRKQSFIVAFAALAVAGLVAAGIYWAMRPVEVPADAVSLVFSGTGSATITPHGRLYDVSSEPEKVRQRSTFNIDGTRAFKVKGTVSVKVSGQVKIAVADTATLEPPDRHGLAFTLGSDKSVDIGSVLPVHYRATGFSKVTVNDLARVSAVDCGLVESYGKSTVFATNVQQINANTWSTVEADNSKQVIANDNSRVTAKNSEEVIAKGTSKVTAENCKRLLAQDQSEVKPKDCESVEIKDGAKKVWFFSILK